VTAKKYFIFIYVPKKKPLVTTVPNVNKFNKVNALLRVEDFLTPQATITEKLQTYYLLQSVNNNLLFMIKR